ncbi:unnamed protein product [Hermetia illucens]|uniref:Myosin-M heavy chain n=2 Tax=Hermetia illucens TaxID=343691 RepID=A0A7R8UML7_HERIL|nr:unnamed protein product [Hermetia illucens]
MYDKTKKTWSQRLKITKSEKIPSPLSELPDYSQSALSRSMKYAEPWLYGTVRGIPAPPVHGQAIFTPIPAEVAVVVCSCPEYLNGTKKEVKKASVCKKCKGSRLPLAPIGGTVRIRPTSAPIVHTPRASVGTVRLPSSSSKIRPSILDPKNDPYDLMRRSRLVSPEPKSIPVDKALKLRAKSASPTRGRSRNRPPRVGPDELLLSNGTVVINSGSGSIRPRNTMRMKPERWLEGMEHDSGTRKSILQCDVNPYDLISNKSQTNSEFAPEQDEMFLPTSKREPGQKKVPATNNSHVRTIAGQRISIGESASKNSKLPHFDRNASNLPTSIPRKVENTTTADNQRCEQTLKLNSPKIQMEHVKPKRPPRRKHETSSADEDSTEISEQSTKITNEENFTRNLTPTPSSSAPSTPTQVVDSVTLISPSGRQGIKSILKRPSSVMPSSSDTETKNKDSCRQEKTGNSNTNSGNSMVKGTSGTIRLTTFSENGLAGEERVAGSGSLFYLPLPQTRKKVQFMVENRIIHQETDDDSADKITVGAPPISVSKDENATLKRKELRIQSNAANNEQTVKDTNGLRNEGNTEEKRQQQDVDSLQREQGQNWTRSRIEMSSNRDSYKDSCKNDSEKSTTMAIRNSSTNSNGVIVVNTRQRNGLPPQSRDEEQKQTKSGELLAAEDGSVEHTDQEGQDGFESDTTTITTPSTYRSPTRRGASLRRTHSARSNNTTTVLLNFNDTMALRIKNIRPDSRDIFCESGVSNSSSPSPKASSSTLRPHGNPPDPPLSPLRKHQEDSPLSSPASLASSAVAQGAASSTSSSPDSKENSKEAVSPAARRKSTSTDDKNPTSKELLRHKDKEDFQLKDATRVLVVDSSGETQPARPPRQVNKKIPWQQENGTSVTVRNEHRDNPLKDNAGNISNEGACGSNKENNANGNINVRNEGNEKKTAVTHHAALIPTEPVQKGVHPGKMSEKEKMLQARNEILNGSRLFGSVSDKGVQKTVVRVAPFNKDGSEVHRLKIRHEDENTSPILVSQKKTSILINGDNCYSTVNVSSDTPLYQSSVVVNNGVSTISTEPLRISSNTVTINVSNPSTPEEEIICKNNKINSILTLNSNLLNVGSSGSTVSHSSSSSTIGSDGDSSSYSGSLKRGSTFVTLDFGSPTEPTKTTAADKEGFTHEQELVQILRNPVEAVKRNLVPHVCGKLDNTVYKSSLPITPAPTPAKSDSNKPQNNYSFIGKLLEDPTLHQLAEGLESEVVVKLIENSLKRLKDSRQSVDTSGTKDNEDMNKLIDLALQKVREERMKLEVKKRNETSNESTQNPSQDQHENCSISSGNSYGSANYDLFDFENNESDCYQSCSSEMTTEEDAQSTRSKFYQMLVDATLSEIEISTSNEDDHHYESIRMNCDPIYEEISDVPPPLPLSPPPVGDVELDKRTTRSMFEGASKYDILSYLVDAKERGIVREEPYEYNFSNTSEIIVEEEIDTLTDLNKNKIVDVSSRISHLSVTSDSSEDISLTSSINEKLTQRRPTSEVERNDSGVGSETSKSSRSKYQNPTSLSVLNKNSPIHLCEDCDGPVETQVTDSGVMFAPLVCRKCSKKRAERKEIIIEIAETEEKYGRDLQIILEEFCKPMLVAGLLTQEQLSAIFLNTEELLENNQALAEKIRDALDIAMEQGDDDLLTVNIGKVFLEATPMLHAFESYCVRQAAASLLLANLEKDKELLRIFLRVSQMENAVLRRMNLNSFLMVPVQRVTKYPLLLARLYKVTPPHLESRPLLKQAQEKIELHLNHMNQEAKDVPTKLWRRISSSSPNRRSSCEIDMINIKLRKMAIDVLEWNHDEVRFAMEGKLLYTQPTDSNWKRARTIKLTHINALLVTNGKPSATYKPDKAIADQLSFPKHTGIREAALLMVKEKCGRYTLIREPLYLDRCIVCTEADWDDYFEVHEISSKDTFIFKAEDGTRTKQWYTQLQYHSQGMGAWRKRRNALANIMINGMLSRT